MRPIAQGVCRYCGCTDASPCWDCKQTHDQCVWVDATQTTVCGAGSCRKAWGARRAAMRQAAKTERLSSSQVHDRIAGRKGKAR